MNRPFFSIIIPCYNAEKTLEAAIKSVTKQSFKDIEVLVVDDASRDWSFALAHRLADDDPRIKVIALADNNGAAKARNKGIEQAQGTYIMFLDSDDVYSEGLLEKVKEAAADKTDVIMWGLREEYLTDGQITYTKDITYPDTLFTGSQSIRNAIMDLEELSLYGYLWNKAYAAQLAKEIEIPDQSFNEDEMFNIKFFNNVSTARILDFAGTHYRKTDGTSLTHRELFDYYPLAMKRVAELMQQHKMWQLYTEDVHQRLADIYLRYMLSQLERMHRPAMGMGDRNRKLFMQRVFSSRLYREMCPAFKPQSYILKKLAKALKKQDCKKCLRIGRNLYRIKHFAPAVFEWGKRR